MPRRPNSIAAQARGGIADRVAEVEGRRAARSLILQSLEVADERVEAGGRAAERDADVIAVDRLAAKEARVLERKPAAGDRQLADAIDPPQFAGRNEGGGIKAVDVAGHVRTCRARVEVADGTVGTSPLKSPRANAAVPTPNPEMQPSPVTASSCPAIGLMRLRYHNDSVATVVRTVTVRIACSLIAGALLSFTRVQPQQPADPLDDLFTRGRAAQAATKTLDRSLYRDQRVQPAPRSAGRNRHARGRDAASRRDALRAAHGRRPSRSTTSVSSSPGRRAGIVKRSTSRRPRAGCRSTSPTPRRNSCAIFSRSRSHPTSRTRRTSSTWCHSASRSPKASTGCGSGSIGAGCMMIKMTLDYPGGDSKTLELHDVRTNVPIDESAFAILARQRELNVDRRARSAQLASVHASWRSGTSAWSRT